MRFIYKYRFAVIAAAACLLIAAIIYAVRSPEDRPELKRASFSLPQEDKDWIRNNPKVTVGVDLDFAPIEQLDHNGRYVGVTADFLALVTEKTGLKFNIDTDSTWAQSLARIKEGKIHMLGAAGFSLPCPLRCCREVRL